MAFSLDAERRALENESAFEVGECRHDHPGDNSKGQFIIAFEGQ
jgi:hypothetical protein